MTENHPFNDPQHWRNRAKEARVLAEQMHDDVSRATMLEIAEDYEKLAAKASLRIAGDRKTG